jgi:hypothetical protein
LQHAKDRIALDFMRVEALGIKGVPHIVHLIRIIRPNELQSQTPSDDFAKLYHDSLGVRGTL